MPESQGVGHLERWPRDSWDSRVARSIDTYYREVWIDYSIVWYSRSGLAFHFGYFEDGSELVAGHSCKSSADHSQALDRTNQILADLARVAPGDLVLDAGCAFGASSFWLAEQRAANLIGIANVEDSIRRARNIGRKRLQEGRVHFLTADYMHLPFADGCFDVVWALESLCHAPDKARFYREATRVLKPGGRLVVSEYMRRTRELTPEQSAIVDEWLRGWAIPDLDTGKEHCAAADVAGLVDVVLRDVTRHTRPSLKRLYRAAQAAYFVNWVLRRLRLRTKAQYGNVIACLRQYQALRQGCWFYGMLSATKPVSDYRAFDGGG